MSTIYELFVDTIRIGKPNEDLEIIKLMASEYINDVGKDCHIEANCAPAPSWALQWDNEVKDWVKTSLPLYKS